MLQSADFFLNFYKRIFPLIFSAMFICVHCTRQKAQNRAMRITSSELVYMQPWEAAAQAQQLRPEIKRTSSSDTRRSLYQCNYLCHCELDGKRVSVQQIQLAQKSRNQNSPIEKLLQFKSTAQSTLWSWILHNFQLWSWFSIVAGAS